METEYLEELRIFLCKQKFDFFGTLVFNDTVSSPITQKRWLDCLYQRIYRFHQHTDKKILGPNYWRFPIEQRTFFFCFIEHLNSNPHGHLLITAPAGKSQHYAAIAPAVWNKLCPAGDLLLSPIVGEDNLRRTVSYATKDLVCRQNCEEFIISSEFVNKYK